MWISDIFFTMGWLAIAFAKNAWWLDLGRLLMGFGVGLVYYVVPVYIAEITPKNLRGGFTSATQLMTSCGFSLMFFIGTIVNWRTLALMGSIPCLVQLIGLFFIPESPRWLAKIGREKELEAVLQRLRGKTADISQESADIREYTETFEQFTKSRILDLFQQRYAHSLIVGVGLMVLQQFGGSTAIAYHASDIFMSAGFLSNMGSVVMAIVQDLHWWKEITPILVFIGILASSASFAVGIGGIPWVIMSEIFPINMKGSAGSLVALVNWFCALLTTYTFIFILKWSSAGTFLIYSVIWGATVLFIAKLVPETKGCTLEEIQASLNHFV